MISSLERQGYTVLFAYNDYDYVYSLYRQMPELIKVVIGDAAADGRSYRTILKTDKLPDGVPAWKWFYPYYYPNPFTTVVGSKWVIGAEPTEAQHLRELCLPARDLARIADPRIHLHGLRTRRHAPRCPVRRAPAQGLPHGQVWRIL
jgi:hypothetical protein